MVFSSALLVPILVFMGCGAVAGLLAGLLGVGGGIVIVPMLDIVFEWLHYPPELIHQLALGTSLATIVITSISSSRAHAKRGAVHWDIFAKITPGILVGTFCGGLVATHMPTTFLKIFFIVFILFVACQMLSGYRPKASRDIPGTWGTMGVGTVIGGVSSFVGIGGGTLSVPFMTFCNVPMHEAVGTSAAIGFPIAVAYVSLFAWAGIAAVSFCTAPLGARLSHALPTAKLKKVFALFLIIIAARMIWQVAGRYFF